MAETTNFEAEVIGQPPAGWTCGATGRGNPKWSVEADKSSSGGGKVLRQSGVAAFPWCVRDNTKLADGWVEVKFKPLAGREDQAGGLVCLDGTRYIDVADTHITAPGAVGVCTKADSVTSFSDFAYEAAR